MKAYIEVRHNIEVAHRLFESPGKCENIHGHSMWVSLKIYGTVNGQGMLQNHFGKALEFGQVKHSFRNYLDTQYDHHLLLNRNDPFAGPLGVDIGNIHVNFLPGLIAVGGDPTTENLALWIAEWSQNHFAIPTLTVHVSETSVNGAGVIFEGESDGDH